MPNVYWPLAKYTTGPGLEPLMFILEVESAGHYTTVPRLCCIGIYCIHPIVALYPIVLCLTVLVNIDQQGKMHESCHSISELTVCLQGAVSEYRHACFDRI